MTTLLPPSVPSQFGRQFDRKPYSFGDRFFACSSAAATSSSSLGAIIVDHARQITPTSINSARSLPLRPNDENYVPPIDRPDILLSQTRKRSALPSDYNTKLLGTPVRYPSAIPKRPYIPAQVPAVIERANPSSESRVAGAGRDVDAPRRPLLDLQQHLHDARGPAAPYTPLRRDLEDSSPAPLRSQLTLSDATSSAPPVASQRWTEKPSQNQVDSIQEDKSRNYGTHWPSTPAKAKNLIHYRNRPSDVSSACVHTVKTASLSNDSCSLLPRSLRNGHSTETQTYGGSHARFSIDSDRPPTTSSLDEAAIRRGTKRRQLLQELVESEESYLSDLKALVYLYSTLLATTSALPDRIKIDIQRNVTELLHLHEHLIVQLRHASMQAATRKWNETVSPRRLGLHHLRFRSDSIGISGSAQKHRHTRSSQEASGSPQAHIPFRSAEPSEVAEIARIFKASVSRFFAYEEYCVKYEVIAFQMQRLSPKWSSFETGIEALAKSLMALNVREMDQKKALSVADLLIKPVQRVCRYPLLLAELCKNTPAADCPTSHSEIESALHCFRDVVKEVNLAADDPIACRQIQRRWRLYERLIFNDNVLPAAQFRSLGHIRLCGVLHVVYRSKSHVDGCYALSMLYESYFVLAIPAGATGKFSVMALIHLSDMKVDSPSDGRGLQCHNALFTWKLSFEADGQLYEMIMSACSSVEEVQWVSGLQKRSQPYESPSMRLASSISLAWNLRPTGTVFGQAGTLTRRLSIQRAATVGNRTSVCQVIVRNTHNPQDLQDFRKSSPSAIKRSQSHLTANRIVVLAPKRSERARLEAILANVWTRDKLPFPGMIASRGGQIIRASAGSLVRKLSLASMHGPFGRRSSSLTLSTQKSYEAFMDARTRPGAASAPFSASEVREEDVFEKLVETNQKSEAQADQEDQDLHEQAEKSPSIPSKRLSLSGYAGNEGLVRRVTKMDQRTSNAGAILGPEDPAQGFYASVENEVVEDRLGRRKRWHKPVGFLKNLSADGLRHMLYTSK